MSRTATKTGGERDPNDRRRWLALLLVCVAQLMIVVDGTVVNVALPAIRGSLGFSETGLSWVVNAYLLTFGGFLLLGGRAGDLFGRRRVFAFGLGLFTFASLLCGVSGSQGLLVAARALQGVGGAIIAPAALSIIITTFKDPESRARAMGVWAFVVSGGASVGVLLGGALTQTFGWPWIFFVNIPVGLAALALCRPLLDPDPKRVARDPGASGGFDLPGAFLVTSSIVAAVYAIVGAAQNPPAATGLILALSAALMAAFAAVERRTRDPLVPPGVFARSRNLTASNAIMALAVVGMFGWFFFSALYLRRVLGYDSLATGLAFLPATLALGVISQGPAARAVKSFGIKRTIIGGLGLMALGLLLFARAPADGRFLLDVLPGMLVLGVGAAFGFMAVILAATADVPEEEAGLASGLVNTSQQMGGALGLAALAAVAAYVTGSADPEGNVAALNAGYHAAFLAGAGCVVLGALFAAVLLRLPAGAGPE
ncbi:MAG TPA: MFS transporter [Rubrobacter sp.]|jgi:EmrB/QacA subfamily drug resistance transporter|nr:MFS transporter [Rubrobacter sp.]